MSVNCSSPSNASLPPSFSVHIYDHLFRCLNSTAGAFHITTFTITGILLLLPLYIYILYLGLQQKQRFNTTVSHSDLLTYHMVTKESLSVLGSTLICFGVHTDLPTMIMVGIYLCSMILGGQIYFHVLTCVDRYLAVVHPIIYLSLKRASGIRTNIAIGFVWLLSLVWIIFMHLADRNTSDIFFFCITGFALIIVSFCSLSVLCVLIRARPGEVGGGRQQVDQLKLRAFYTIMVILGVLLFRFVSNMLIIALQSLDQLGEPEKCILMFSVVWVCLPSSLVLPLLFLQREGKLICLNKNNKSR